MGIFGDNLIRIATHNADKTSTFKMGMNEFGDMTEEEFGRTYLSGLRAGYRPEPRYGEDGKGGQNIVLRGNALQEPPASVDWAEKGAVTNVKNQGSCGSCWAFSAIAAMESHYFIKTGNLIEFSEQEVVSCDGDGVHGGVDYACQGGFMDNAFDWVEHATSGVCTETDYPYSSGYTSARGECRMSECTAVPGSQIQGYVDVPPSEDALLTALAEHGPLSVGIEADQSAFQFYHSGVLHGPCGNSLNHGVLAVGYGVDADTGAPYWKVKNSWGSGWGEQGYVRIQRGKRWPRGGECGIASKASYPVF
jgi:KDEL-tailed cysteine endopeptidase